MSAISLYFIPNNAINVKMSPSCLENRHISRLAHRDAYSNSRNRFHGDQFLIQMNENVFRIQYAIHCSLYIQLIHLQLHFITIKSLVTLVLPPPSPSCSLFVFLPISFVSPNLRNLALRTFVQKFLFRHTDNVLSVYQSTCCSIH